MTFFRVGPAGIPGSIKTDMNNVLNKKFGTTGQDYPPTDWPADVNLLGELEVKTASGSIASFTDGADGVPVKNWLVTLPASLSGYSEVNAVRSGKNLFNAYGTDTDEGYIQYYYLLNTGETYYNSAWSTSEYIEVKENLQYTLSGIIGGNPSICFYDENKTFLSGVKYGNASPKTVTTPTGAKFARVSFENALKDVWQLEVGSTPTQYTAYEAPTQYTASLGRTIYGGQADIVTGEGEDENGNAFTFTPIQAETELGTNNFWADEGDSDVDYRSSGTVTTITPTLITKSITENGTYNAADDNADGFSQVTVNVSGGGSFTPTFTETLIADNTAHASSFTLSEDYNNYDLVKIVWYESGTSSGYVVTTPDILDEIFSVTSKVCINKLNTNLYVCYSKAGLTWTQANQRTLFVHEIYGITLTNCTMTATDIYKRGGMSDGAVTITSLTSLKDYDLFALSSQHSTDGTETMPCSWFLQYPNPDPIETAFGNPQPYVLEEYNQNNETFYMSEYEMTAAKYFMVQGLIFTPTV